MREAWSKLQRTLPTRFSLAAGFLWALSTPFWGKDFRGLSFLAILFFTPLFVLVEKSTSWRQLVLQLWWVQTIYYFITFYWIPQGLKLIWQTPTWFNLVFFLFLSLFSQPQIFLIPVLRRLSKVKSLPLIPRSLMLALVYSILDLVYPKLLNDTVAHSFYQFDNLLSHLSFPKGTYVLTFAIVFIGLLLAELVLLKALPKFLLVSASTLLIFLFVPRSPDKSANGAHYLDLVSINTKFPISHKADRFKDIIDALKSVESLSENTLIVFPESTYPYGLLTAEDAEAVSKNEEFFALIRERKMKIIIGNSSKVDGSYANTHVFLSPAETSVSIEYIPKQILFPFGESVPLGQHFPWLVKLVPSRLLPPPPKRKKNYFTVAGFNIGVGICYEIIFPDLFQKFNSELDLILNPTNELVYYGLSSPAVLTFALTVFSSAENQVPIVRTANTGFHGIADHGKILEFGPVDNKVHIRRHQIFKK